MVIDAHFHLTFFEEICPTEELAQHRRDLLAYYKTGRTTAERVREVMHSNGIDKVFLLPFDYSTTDGDLVTVDEVKRVVELGKGDFIGFAAVDPARKDALEVLEYAFRDLGLAGLKLHPGKQGFHPASEKMFPIYELCIKYNKPVIFHSGISWEPGALSECCRPIHFEPLAVRYPQLRFCLAHMGFPWVTEAAALMAKYPNIYADTGLMYFDSAQEFYNHVFDKQMDHTWVDRGIRHQVLFGTNSQRWIPSKMLEALNNLGLRKETVDLITCRNALEFLGEEKVTWIS